MNSGQRVVAVTLIFVGLYVMVTWGILGHSPLTDVQAKTSTNTSGTGSITSNAPVNPGLFGLPGIHFSGYGEQYNNTVRTADQQGLLSAGGGTLAHDFDYAANGGSPFKLPGTPNDKYTFIKNESGLWGNLYYFRTPNGGRIGFTHIENALQLSPGTIVSGGTIIGTVGKGPYSATYWSGPHLSVIVDSLGLGWLNSLSYKQ